MEREEIGAGSLEATADQTQTRRILVGGGTAPRGRAPHKGEEPALPFWLVTLLFLGLPVTLAGVLLVTWMVLFD